MSRKKGFDSQINNEDLLTDLRNSYKFRVKLVRLQKASLEKGDTRSREYIEILECKMQTVDEKIKRISTDVMSATDNIRGIKKRVLNDYYLSPVKDGGSQLMTREDLAQCYSCSLALIDVYIRDLKETVRKTFSDAA